MGDDFGRVAVLFGGDSAEREVSLRSGNAILNSLIRQGIDAIGIDPKIDDLVDLKQKNIDRVFIALHGRGGEDGTIQGFLSTLNIPFTGSDVMSSAIAMDKSRTKQIWQSLNLPTANCQIIVKDNFDQGQAKDILRSLSGKVIVKPVNEGSSIGMAKVENEEQLIVALSDAFKFDNRVMIEAWITGQEFTVSMLNEEVLPAIRMHTEHAFYDYQAKYQSGDTEYYCPCGLEQSSLAELNMLSVNAFKAIGCSGWGRVDVMRDQAGKWYLLEVNTVPGMTETSLVPKAAKQAGYDFDQLVLQILKQTL